MKLQEFEVCKYRYLRKAYEVISANSISIYGVYIKPYELGMELGFDENLVYRIVDDLVFRGLLESTLGMQSIALNQYTIDFLTKQEAVESSKSTYDCYYLTSTEYDELIATEKPFTPHYRVYLRIEILSKYTADIFDGKILCKSSNNKFDYATSDNSRSNSIIRGIKQNRSGNFTFDGITFFVASNMRTGATKELEFTFTKVDYMKNEQRVSIQGITNSVVNVMQDSNNNQVQIGRENLSPYLLISELRTTMRELLNELNETNQKSLVVAIDYLEDLIKNGDTDTGPVIIRQVKEILKSIPTETISSILSEPIIKYLGL